MAQVQYAGGAFPRLPSNFPSPPPEGYYPGGGLYGDPGINPNASQRPDQTAFEKWVGDILRGIHLPGGFAVPAEGQTPEATARAGEAVKEIRRQGSGDASTLEGPGFCLGLDKELCSTAGVWKPFCSFVSNIACLFVGLTILLALLGLGVHGILK